MISSQNKIMEKLLSFQNSVLKQTHLDWSRYLLPQLQTQERLLGLKGLRGVGKTTLLLQYLKYSYSNRKEGLYVTADHPYFYSNTLFELAETWTVNNGKLLLIDEIHKYSNWSRELKLIYDAFPSLHVIFTSSSALDLYRGESDLSRRLITQTLHGLSFREFLDYRYQLKIKPQSFLDILKNHQQISEDITSVMRPLPLFHEYCANGYFPFITSQNKDTAANKLLQTINTVLESDLAFSQDYSAANISKIKKLLGVLSTSVPFEPNISKIAEKLQLGRNSVNQFLHHLHDAKIIRLINRPNKGLHILQKPDKIYFENTNFSNSFQLKPDLGNLRETFFSNQIHNAGEKINLHPEIDFLINEQYGFEVGGKNKTKSQIKNIENSFLVKDDIEIGFGNTIPLYIFGLMY